MSLSRPRQLRLNGRNLNLQTFKGGQFFSDIHRNLTFDIHPATNNSGKSFAVASLQSIVHLILLILRVYDVVLASSAMVAVIA